MEKVERVQYQAALAFTGAWYGSSRTKLYEELGWDHNVGQINQAIKDAGIEENTIVVFISDNGPTTTSTIPEEINMGSAGQFRGELGDATEGSIRTVGMIKWPVSLKREKWPLAWSL